MAVIWGFGGKTKNPDDLWVPYWCTHCREMQPFLVAENYRYGHVYGIRVAKYKAQYFLSCVKCQDAYGIDDKPSFVFAQEIGRKIKAAPIESLNLLELAQEVASKVLHNFEAAQLFSNMRQEEISETRNELNKARAEIGLEPLPQISSSEIGQAESLAIVPEDEKECPDCAERIKAAARKCRFCGYRFDEA